MKYKKILRILAMASILVLLSVPFSASPALAYYEDIQLDPDEGKIGDRIDIDGDDFEKSYYYSETNYHYYYVDIYFSSEEADEGDDIDDEVENYERVKYSLFVDDDGEFRTYFYVPDELTDGEDDEDVIAGTYYLYVTYASDDNIVAVAEFTVVAPEISLNVTAGTTSTEIQISGTYFGSKESVTVEFDTATMAIESGSSTTNTDGDFTLTFLVPESTAGSHTVTVTGDDSDSEASRTFTVQPNITVNPESVSAAYPITVSGTGFARSVNYTISLNGASIITNQMTDIRGSFTTTLSGISTGAGSHNVSATDLRGNTSSASFTLVPATVSISPTTGRTGISISVSGTNFQASKSVTVTFDNENVATVITDKYGKFSANFDIPARNAGIYTVKVTDGAMEASTSFTITTDVIITPITSTSSPGFVGTELSINGVGFVAGQTVNVNYDNTPVATATVGSNGSFTTSFKVPSSKGGSHIIVASDGTSTVQLTFVMESTPPPIPQPLKPEMDIKTRANTFFDWEPVTDPSGVTYTLEIATSDAFSEDSIVLRKTGLSETEYTLTQDEKLRPEDKDAPYYWHVRAIDGASNAGQWAGSGSFYVGGFNIPQPVIYVVLGIGALLLGGVLGFWLGRKMEPPLDRV